MIPTILYLLLKKYRRTHPDSAQKLEDQLKKICRPLALTFLFIAVAQFVLAQEKKLEYVIKRKGNEVGTLTFTHQQAGHRVVMKMESEVRTRLILLFTAKAKEETVYDNGIMTWSSIYRKMNGNEKANKRTTLSGTSYVITEDEENETVTHFPIRYNMLSLYVQEPTGISKVYSDNFERLLDIQTIAPHHYKIKFPDGNYNEYFFSQGICTRIRIHHSFYSASIELKS